MELFKMGLTAEKTAQKIVILQDKTVPELQAALEQARQASLDLRKNRIMGEVVAEKQIQEADRVEENIRRELTASESAIDDLTEFLRNIKSKENAKGISDCERIMEEFSREEKIINERIFKAAAAFKAAVFERDGVEMPEIFGMSLATCREHSQIFDDEFNRLMPKGKSLDVRKRTNDMLFQALRIKTPEELADEGIAKARGSVAVPAVV